MNNLNENYASRFSPLSWWRVGREMTRSVIVLAAGSGHRLLRGALVLALFAVCAAPARAEIFATTETLAFFNDPTKWYANIPGPGGIAEFYYIAPPFQSAYAVSGLFPQANAKAVVGGARVFFDLNGQNYTLTDSLGGPSLQVGVANSSSNASELVISGGTLTTADVGLGMQAGYNGGLGVFGSLITQNTIYVGHSSSASMQVGNGGSVLSVNSIFGKDAGAFGAAGVENGGRWDTTNLLQVGSFGSGLLSVITGGQMTSATAYIAAESGSTGAVQIANAGTVWISGPLYVGGKADRSGGAGTLTVADSGYVKTDLLKVWDNGTVDTNSGSTVAVNLEIVGGGTVSSASGRLSRSDLAVNGGLTVWDEAIVDGSESKWEISGNLSSGTSDILSHLLRIHNGGMVTNTNALLGEVGATTVNVSGGGSMWTNSGNIITNVGSAGPSQTTINVNSGGQVDAVSLILGRNGGPIGIGSLYVDLGGQVDLVGTLQVQQNGAVYHDGGEINAANMFIDGGGTVNANRGWVYFGDTGNSNAVNVAGNALVTGAGSTLNATDTGIQLGFIGSSRLDVKNGGTVSTTRLLIANTGNESGILDIDASTVATSGKTELGAARNATGQVFVRNGGVLDTTRLYVGGVESTGLGTGLLSVESAGIVDVAGELKVWDDGEVNLSFGNTRADTLAIEGGTVRSNGGASIGTSVAGGLSIDASATVNGAGALLDVGDLSIGRDNEASLDVTAGGRVEATSLTVSHFTRGTLTVDASTVVVSGQTKIGERTTGIVNLQNGATLETAAMSLGNAGHSGGVFFDSGTVNVTGASTLSVGGELAVYDASTVNHAASSTVTADALNIKTRGIFPAAVNSSAAAFIVGRDTPSNGNFVAMDSVTVEGGQALLDFDGSFAFTVGESAGTLDVLSGGRVDSAADVRLGTGAGSSGTINIAGATFNAASEVEVGYGDTGTGMIDVSNGGILNAIAMYVGGRQTGSFGTGTLNVSSGLVDVNSTLKVWNQGTVNQTGGTISVASFDASLGSFVFDNGTVNVNGGSFTDGQTSLTLEGTGAGDNPTLNLIGGSVSYTDGVIGQVNGGTLHVSNAGTATFTNSLTAGTNGTIVNDGGTISASGFDASLGTFHFNDGTFNLNGGSFTDGQANLVLDGAGAGDHTTLNMNGGTAIYTDGAIGQVNGGTLQVNSGSAASFSNTLTVGSNGNVNHFGGTIIAEDIIINEGGVSTDSVFSVGSNTASGYINATNQATVAGPSALLDVDDELKVWGDGTLTNSGGTISAASFDASLGSFVFDNGTVNVNGGSFTDGQATLVLEGAGAGDNPMLNLNGGSVSYTDGVIGQVNGGTLQVSNGGTATFGNNLTAGANGTIVNDGGTISVASFDASLGTFDFNDGTVNVNGDSFTDGQTTLTLDGASAGDNTTLNLNGGSVSYTDGAIGQVNGGTLQVTNAGTATFSNNLTAGTNGTIVNDGGTISAANVDVSLGTFDFNDGTVNVNGGIFTDGQTTLTLDGAGVGDNPTLNLNDGDVSYAVGVIGQVNGGTLQVINGGAAVFSSSLTAGTNGTIVNDGGVISVLNFDASLGTFTFNDGTVNVVNGGSFTDGQATLTLEGAGTGDNPTLNLLGANTTYTNGAIGQANGGTLVVINGSTATFTDTLTVRSKGTIAHNDSTMHVGNFLRVLGNNVIEGPSVFTSASDWVRIGANPNVVGSVNIANYASLDGPGATLNANGVIVDNDGSGSSQYLSVSNGASLNADQLIIGNTGNATASVSVVKATGIVDGATELGYTQGSDGWLVIENDAAFTTDSLYIGGRSDGSYGSGHVRVRGDSIVYSGPSTLNVTGELKVWDGGSLLNTGGTISVGSLDASLGAFAFHDGFVNVNGGNFTDGQSTLVLQGSSAGDNPTLHLNGGNTTYADGAIGQANGGTLQVSNGGTAAFSSTLTVSDNGTIVNDGGTISVASFDASLGTFSFNDGSVSVNGGSFTDGQATLVLEGAGAGDNTTLNLNGGSVSYTDGVIGQVNGGALQVTNGGTATFSNNLTVGDNGTVNFTDGTLMSDIIDHTNGGTFNFTGGTLSVDFFLGNLNTQGGTLSPGNSPGTTTVIGDYTQDALSTLLIEIDGLTPGSEFDELLVTGTASLDGTLDLDLLTYNPVFGDTFDIIQADAITGDFTTLDLPLLSGTLAFATEIIADPVGTDVFRLSVVPEPATLVLMGLGVALVGVPRRRARKGRPH